jgi:hypothetical protein
MMIQHAREQHTRSMQMHAPPPPHPPSRPRH